MCDGFLLIQKVPLGEHGNNASHKAGTGFILVFFVKPDQSNAL